MFVCTKILFRLLYCATSNSPMGRNKYMKNYGQLTTRRFVSATPQKLIAIVSQKTNLNSSNLTDSNLYFNQCLNFSNKFNQKRKKHSNKMQGCRTGKQTTHLTKIQIKIWKTKFTTRHLTKKCSNQQLHAIITTTVPKKIVTKMFFLFILLALAHGTEVRENKHDCNTWTLKNKQKRTGQPGK